MNTGPQNIVCLKFTIFILFLMVNGENTAYYEVFQLVINVIITVIITIKKTVIGIIIFVYAIIINTIQNYQNECYVVLPKKFMLFFRPFYADHCKDDHYYHQKQQDIIDNIVYPQKNQFINNYIPLAWFMNNKIHTNLNPQIGPTEPKDIAFGLVHFTSVCVKYSEDMWEIPWHETDSDPNKIQHSN